MFATKRLGQIAKMERSQHPTLRLALMAGSRLFKIVRQFNYRKEELLQISEDRILVLAQAGDVTRDSIFDHFSRLVRSSSIGDATRKRRDERAVAALRFGPKHDVVVVSDLSHQADTIVLWKSGQTHAREGWSAQRPHLCLPKG